MRTLLISPELPLSFWSFPKACRFGGHKAVSPPLGLLTLAALLPTAWEMRLADLNTRKLEDKDWQWADLIMISAMHIQKVSFLDSVREAKSRGKTVVAGGPYPTFYPEEALEAGCDFVVRGEGENTVPLLLDAMRNVASGVINNDEKPDISASPVPRFDLLQLEDYRGIAIQTSRGCPFDCEFCDVVRFLGHRPRYKTPQQVIAELETLFRLGVRGPIFFCDDNFIGSKKHAQGILQELIPWLKDRGDPFNFITQSSVNLGHDREMMDLMIAAGFERVFIGIESPDEKVLATTRKYHNLKHSLVESIHNMQQYGIEVIGSFILGFDGEKQGAGERICAFIDQTAIPMAMVNPLQAPPHSGLWQRLAREGRLRTDVEFVAEGIIGQFNFETDRPEAEILNEYANVWDYLYEPSRYLARAYRYCLAMPPTRREMRGAPGPSQQPGGVPEPGRTWRRQLIEIKRLCKILWWLGVRESFRRQFWTQLMGMWRQNPTRLFIYLRTCALGLDLFDLRLIVRKKVTAMLNGPKRKTAAGVLPE